MSKTLETEKKLNDALNRILEKRNENTPIGKKLSYSLVEDEAQVGRSLIRSYPSVFEKTKELILLQKAKKEIGKSKVGSISVDKKTKEQNKNLKEENKELKEKIDNLIKANIGLAERVRYLESR